MSSSQKVQSPANENDRLGRIVLNKFSFRPMLTGVFHDFEDRLALGIVKKFRLRPMATTVWYETF
jgi:hypothetical protein